MCFNVSTEVLPDHIRVAASGEYTLVKLFGFIDRIKIEADTAGRDRVLIDPRQVNGKMTEADRFRAGQHIAEVFGPKLKAACMMPADQITKLGELTAVNRGARFFVTGTEAEALKWLLSS